MGGRRLLQIVAQAASDRTSLAAASGGAGLRWWPNRHHFLSLVILAHVAAIAFYAVRFVQSQRRAAKAASLNAKAHKEPPRPSKCTYEWSGGVPRMLGSLPLRLELDKSSADPGTPRTPSAVVTSKSRNALLAAFGMAKA